MSEEDKELLARIGQLAGQINRHKTQQAGSLHAPGRHLVQHRHNTYRHATAPYHQRGYRGGRPPTVHRHRTLQLNSPAASSHSSGSPADSTPDPSSWVSKTDRHRQLINASVYEKESQNRTRAIEETRQRNLVDQRKREKLRFRQFLGHQAVASSASATNPGTSTGNNEITIDGIVFKVMDGGKKLARSTSDTNSASATPKVAVVAGVKFYRTKTGNLVANRIVQNQRRSGVIKKVGERCKTFSTTGAPVCRDFGYYGFCDRGAECTERHVFECPDFSNTGRCRTKGCKLPHRERASVLRNLAKPDDMIEDVSSGDEAADSDDVDSDEVAEFIEAESDDSDFENPKSFLAV
ncbi:CCCH zinc finger protein [Paramyrothecium foliicola]|nr:CCCH zinc finger protein [Paramyrothecium foliicola]